MFECVASETNAFYGLLFAVAFMSSATTFAFLRLLNLQSDHQVRTKGMQRLLRYMGRR